MQIGAYLKFTNRYIAKAMCSVCPETYQGNMRTNEWFTIIRVDKVYSDMRIKKCFSVI